MSIHFIDEHQLDDLVSGKSRFSGALSNLKNALSSARPRTYIRSTPAAKAITSAARQAFRRSVSPSSPRRTDRRTFSRERSRSPSFARHGRRHDRHSYGDGYSYGPGYYDRPLPCLDGSCYGGQYGNWYNPSIWYAPYFFGYNPYPLYYDFSLPYTSLDPVAYDELLYDGIVGQPLRPQAPEGFRKISILNFSSYPVQVMVADYDRNTYIEELLTPYNNTLIVDRDINSSFAVGFKTPATGDAYFLPMTKYGTLLKRLDTPLKEPVVYYRFQDPNIVIIRIGESVFYIENVHY